MLTFQNLHIGFHGKQHRAPLFTAEDLTFNKGELVALIGPNGSGKTTLFDNVMGFATPLAGEIQIHGKNLNQLSRQDRVKHLSFVPSKFIGVNHLSVTELIAFGRAPYTNMLNRLSTKDKEIIDKIVVDLGMEKYKDKNTLFLSDGERQIAMIGKALAQESEIMVLDEPTAFLDYNNKRRILKILQRIAAEENKLVFISSHDLELCFAYCNRIIGIDIEAKQLLSYELPFDKDAIIQQIFK